MSQQSDPFSRGGRFAANPHLYDYMHTLAFDPSGAVEMVDGAGQVLNTLVRGRFTVEELGPTEFSVAFAELVDIDPYYKRRRFHDLDFDAYIKALDEDIPFEEQDVRRRLDPCQIHVAREDGLFLLRRQIVWKIKDEQEWPYLLYRVRYRFATDPLAGSLANRQGNLYFQIEAPEPDTQMYYRFEDAEHFTLGELQRAEIAVDEDAE